VQNWVYLQRFGAVCACMLLRLERMVPIAKMHDKYRSLSLRIEDMQDETVLRTEAIKEDDLCLPRGFEGGHLSQASQLVNAQHSE